LSLYEAWVRGRRRRDSAAALGQDEERLRLLLVEDDAQLASRLAERLRASGFAVDVARNFAEGEAWPDLDKIGAVILDLNLPDGSGMDLLRHWRARRLVCPVIILTARGSWQDKVEG
jgi:two-component system OmpR family response regulator